MTLSVVPLVTFLQLLCYSYLSLVTFSLQSGYAYVLKQFTKETIVINDEYI